MLGLYQKALHKFRIELKLDCHNLQAALRKLFDWLVVGYVLEVNPAHAVHLPATVFPVSRRPSKPTPSSTDFASCEPSGKKASRARKKRWTAQPGLQMMTALHSDGVHRVFIEELDRLARDLMVQEAAIAELAKHGFRLVSTCEPVLMSDDPWRPIPVNDGRVFGTRQESDCPQASRCAAAQASGNGTL